MSLRSFDVDGFLGQGGMASVFRATHRSTGRAVALKFLTSSAPETAEAEVVAMARMDHPNIVRVFDFGTTDRVILCDDRSVPAGSTFIAMELADCGSLADLTLTSGFEEVRGVLLAMLSALGHAHANGILHRDVKPENILVVTTPHGRRIKLTDFGIAAPVLSRPHATGVASAGTPAFMAPEMFEGRW